MIRRSFIFTCLVLVLCVPGIAGAQNAELLFMQTSVSKALQYKKGLKVAKLTSANALMLHNMSAERQAAYLKKIGGVDAVIVLETAGAKATAGVGFPMPVIIVNSTEATGAKGAVIRVFDAATDASGAPNLTLVTAAAGFTLPAAALAPGAQTSFKCQGVSDADLVNRILAALKK